MRTRRKDWFDFARSAALAAGVAASLCAADASAAEKPGRSYYCSGDAVCVDARSGLPGRILTRPAARLYAEPMDGVEPIAGNLRAFRPWFVFGEREVGQSANGEATGWYLVGQNSDAPIGWIRASDAFPWRSALVVAYSHPGADPQKRRSPVLMFESLAGLRAMIVADDPGAYSLDLERAVSAGEVERFRNAGLVSMEPKRFVDFRRGFYILPVLDFVRLPLFDGEARMLKLAAAVPQTERDLGRGATRLSDAGYRSNALAAPTTEGTGAAELAVEIKFVIDMTGSMQPQLDAVSRAIAQLAALLDRDRLGAQFRYGLVGFTDVAEQCGDCPFTLARDFTPNGPGTAKDLLAALRDDPAARAAGGGDLPEAAIDGVAAAVNGRWGDNTLRFVVLIGDASANPFGQTKNQRVSVESVRSLADAAQVRIVALHAEHAPGSDAASAQGATGAPGAGADAAALRDDIMRARRQYAQLSLNPGQSAPSYLRIAIDPDSPRLARQRFYDAVYGLAEQMAEQLQAVRAGRVEQAIAARAAKAAPADEASAQAGAVARQAFDAALISYLGSPASRPRDITFWSLDVDPLDFATQSLEVRVLLEKRELETLIRRLEAQLEAFLRAKSVDSGTFFTRLRETSAASVIDSDAPTSWSRSPATAAIPDRLAASERLPRWIASLPYKSQVMGLTPRRFAEMSADERDRLEQSIIRKLYAYRDLYASDEWISLWPGADDFDKVYPLALSELP